MSSFSAHQISWRVIQVNLIFLCLFVLGVALLKAALYLRELFAVMAGVMVLTYLLLGPVDWTETALRALVGNRLGARHLRVLAVTLVFLGAFWILGVSGVRIAPILRLQFNGFAMELPQYLSRLETLRSVSFPIPLRLASEPVWPGSETPKPGLCERFGPSVAPDFLWSHPDPNEPKPAWRLWTETPVERDAVCNGRDIPLAKTWPLPSKPLSSVGMVAFFRQNAVNAFRDLLSVITRSVSGVIHGVVCLVLVFYLLLDASTLQRQFLELCPENHRSGLSHFLGNTHRLLYDFIRGQIVLGLGVGLFMASVYGIFGVKYALLLGSLMGAASVLPVVGPWLGLFPGLIVMAFGPHHASIVWVLGFAGLFYFVKEHWILPHLMGKTLEIHPVVILLTLLVCTQILGLLGLLIAFPVASLLGAFYQYYQDLRCGNDEIHRNADPLY